MLSWSCRSINCYCCIQLVLIYYFTNTLYFTLFHFLHFPVTHPVPDLPLQNREPLFHVIIHLFIHSVVCSFFFSPPFVQASKFYVENIICVYADSSCSTIALKSISDVLHKTLRAEGHNIIFLIYVLRCDRLHVMSCALEKKSS